jgi:hypothetical protein
MAALSTSERNRAARIWARRVYAEEGATAALSHANIAAAVAALDDAFEGLPTALPNQGQSVALNLNAVLPEPFKGTATTAQKSTLLAVWAGVKYGYIPAGGE